MMCEEGSVFGVGDELPGDDCDGAFEFEDDEETIDIETIYRILDEKPDFAEASQDNSSPAGSSADELKNSHLQNGSQMVDWMPSGDSYSLGASQPGTGVSGSFDEHMKMEPVLSPSPAHTCSASLKDWFSLSQGEQPVETCGVSQSEMTSCSISSSFSDHDGNVAFNPVNCDVDTVSKLDDKIIDSKCSPTMVTPYFDERCLGADHTSSVMSGFFNNSSSLSDSADNYVSSAQNCYNTNGAPLLEHTPNFVQNFSFQFFPNKEEAVNDVESGVSESQSDGASRMIFDRHGRVDNGRKPAIDSSTARGISFKCESYPSVSPACGKLYNSFNSHLSDNDLDRPDNCSSSFQENEAVHVTAKPEAESEKVVYSSVPGDYSVRDDSYAPVETNHWWSGASSCAVSYQTDIEKGYSFMAPQTVFPGQDSGNRNSSNFYDSNACMQYVAEDLSPVTQINEHLDFQIHQRDGEHIQPRSIDSNFSNSSFESVQSHSSECISDSDDDSDVCIIETNGPSAIPPRPVAMKKPVVTSEYSTIGHNFNQPGGLKLQSNKENMIFQAALQDLSQPNSEASPPDGVLTVPLLRHQRIALSWMAQKETSGFPCSGGILADDQGLGKTVSTIALILKERSKPAQACEESTKKEIFDLESESGECAPLKPSGKSDHFEHSQLLSNESKVGGDSVGKVRGRPAAGTLVVCPTSVMRQWADELHKKVTSEANLSVLVYHGSSRTKDPHELAKYDVVVTTFSIVSMEVPKQPLVDNDDEEKGGVHDGESATNGVCSNKKRKYPPDSKKKGSKKKKHVEFVSGPLAKVSWFRVVLDEAQSIKNYKTQVARACWGLRAKRRWCLSGTPIQNSIDDLYSYFRFLKYDPYSSYVLFCSTIKNPISRNPVKGYQKLQAILKTVMLRRTKGSFLDGKPIISLPPKSIELRKVDFTMEERDFYSKLEAESRSQFREYEEAGTVKQNYVNILLMLLRLRQACDHPLLVNGDYSFTWESSVGLAKKQIFSEASLAICGICNDAPEDAVVSVCGHVFCKQCIYERLTGDNNHCPFANCNVRLTISSLSSKTRLDDPNSGIQDLVTSNHVESLDPCNDEDLPYGSSKIKAALEILQSLPKPQDLTDTNQISQNREDSCLPVIKSEGMRIDNPIKVAGEKAIVFSQWTKMLDLLEASLVSSRIQYRRLDGTMSVAARDKAVQDFNTLPEVTVMIMSLKAASLGLNMVAACHVLMLDLWWNPTTEDQAIDRAHRIGQTRPVTVVRFTVKDTVEDRILALQQKKRMMVASAFGEDEKGSRQSHLTVEDLSYLFMADS
ncbi:PREDICTED: helicase-like transcription factor CHR28 isoform X1 [Camelina sativa]|uniref:Helicase-like transcription factor CHR28 isoform X1 n=2 Tax=Camelina sativa TaxID=90675 RepID=A0ABM0WMP0_CAMSA|nr:PREDICTED: helicase-like transcription factor CHR28 isoform X1 [Camelina sativa]